MSKELKLLRWEQDNYPPIDLNANVKEVALLIQEIYRLRREVQLKEKAIQLQNITIQMKSEAAESLQKRFDLLKKETGPAIELMEKVIQKIEFHDKVQMRSKKQNHSI